MLNQVEILKRLSEAVQSQNLKIKINEIPPYYQTKVVLDVEHDEQGNFVGAGFLYPGTDTVWYFSDINLVSRLNLLNSEIIGHNVVTDIILLKFWGSSVPSKPYWDTMLIGHMLDSSLKDYSLKGMAKRELGLEYPTYDDIVGKRTKKQKTPRVTLDKQPLEIVTKYNALDVWGTYKLYEKQKRQMGLAVSKI